MLQKVLVFNILLLLLTSCEFRPVHPNLWKIGNYKKRFQPVLDFYSQPKDSLKLRAAQYLIENMGEHYYYQAKNEEKVDSFFQYLKEKIYVPTLSNKKLNEELREELIDMYVPLAVSEGIIELPEYRKQSDIKTISPDFLIENIEYAFKAREFPWARSVSFEDFCRYILPYRYGTEAPESWRKEIYEKFSWVADSIKEYNDPFLAATFVNTIFEDMFSHPGKLTGFRMKISYHFDIVGYKTCMEQAGLGICIFRALGIPATKVSISRWANRQQGHDIVGVLDLNNKWHYINFGDTETETELNYEAPKMFFKKFDNMERYSPVLEDASALFMNVVDLDVKLNKDCKDDIYLCVFGGSGWVPLFKGELINLKAHFRDVGNKNLIYLAAVKSGKKLKAVSYPFSPDSLGNLTYYKPDFINSGPATFFRKYPYAKDKHIPRLEALIGGKFSVSDEKDFTVQKELYTVDKMLNYYNNIIKCSEHKGKYLRYDFPHFEDTDYDGPAEVSFYTTHSDTLRKIEGKYFGSPQLSGKHINMMTDNDILTYLEVWDCAENVNMETGIFVLRNGNEPLWIALETDTITTVTHVGICPRNDKNGIYAGMHYELFYWDNDWNSLGVEVATGDSIIFDGVPENAVFWLRNLDEGNEEWIFTMKDGKQFWR